MKYKKGIKKYFIERRKRLDYFLKLNPKNFKPETFHKLRTEIKKINAVCDILNHCVKSFKRAKTFEPFEIIFKGAGAVRDVQVKEMLFDKYKISLKKNGLAADLEKELHIEKEKFKKQVTKKTITGVKKNIGSVTGVIAELKHKDVERYFKSEEEKIKKLLKQKPEPEKLHELRRQLKIFYYNLKAAGWSRHDVPFGKMDVVQELLGRWHDERVAENYIAERERQKGIDIEEKKRLGRTSSRLKRDTKVLIKRISVQNKELAVNIQIFTR